MSFFIDANVLLYAAAPPSRWRSACLALLEVVAGGGADGRTSTSCLEEVWHLETSGRLGDLRGLTARAYSLLSPLLPVTDDAFRRALSLEAPGLGTNDRLHAGTCVAHGIETIVSADAGFDSVSELRRVDPLDAAQMRALLTPA